MVGVFEVCLKGGVIEVRKIQEVKELKKSKKVKVVAEFDLISNFSLQHFNIRSIKKHNGR